MRVISTCLNRQASGRLRSMIISYAYWRRAFTTMGRMSNPGKNHWEVVKHIFVTFGEQRICNWHSDRDIRLKSKATPTHTMSKILTMNDDIRVRIHLRKRSNFLEVETPRVYASLHNIGRIHSRVRSSQRTYLPAMTVGRLFDQEPNCPYHSNPTLRKCSKSERSTLRWTSSIV